MSDALQTTKDRKLTVKQELFCQLYATDAKFFGNGVQAYIKAYKVDLAVPGAYQVAAQGANENLKKPYISNRINQLLEDIGFSDVEVDKQLAFVIMQHGDLRAKVAGIKEYNALKKRTAQGLPGQLNIINLILQKWGLDNVGEDPGDALRISEN